MAETSGGLPLRSAAVDPELWHACAAAVSHLPEVGSFVVYFPQGHAEQVLPSPSLHDLPPVAPACIPCKITSVEYLADFETDEAYARMCLQPLPNLDLSDVHNEECSESSSFRPREKLVSFAKTLTQSDANNGGGFSIPRYCADTIFPPLDYTQNPPVQMILAKDIHGRLWKFRHIYRGTPRRHLLTTGWSNFVNQKKLVAGDVIVFVRNSEGQLCVGIRRATRGSRHASVPSQFGLQESADHRALLQQELHLGIRAGDNAPKFSRHRNTLVTMQSVVEAAVAASSGNPFEILYYPRASASEFCVNLSTVKKALQVTWVSGMRFKMALETEDASRTNWYMGTVLKLGELDPIRWPKSPWKILQVAWDEGVLQGIERVSPWEIDLVSPTLLPPLSWPRKKLRLLHPQESSMDQVSDIAPVMHKRPPVSCMRTLNKFPMGLCLSMEGARHGPLNGFSVQDNAHCVQPDWFNYGYVKSQVKNEDIGELVPNLGPVGNTTMEVTTDAENHDMMLPLGSSSSSEPALSSNVSFNDEGGSTSSKCTKLILFGKAIDIVKPASGETLQLCTRTNDPIELGQEVISRGRHFEASFSAEGSSGELSETVNAHIQHGESFSASCAVAN